MLTPLADSTFNDRVTQSSPLAVDVSFHFIDVLYLGTIHSLLKHTPHHSSRRHFLLFSKTKKRNFFTFFEVSCQKNVESVVQVFIFVHFEITNGNFHCKTITHMSCYTYSIILKTVHFWLKYNGLAIVRKTTKLIEGGHRGLQDYRHMLLLLRFFYVFSKSCDFLRFFCHV